MLAAGQAGSHVSTHPARGRAEGRLIAEDHGVGPAGALVQHINVSK